MTKKISVQPEWCLELPIQQQSVLFLACRGGDGLPKTHPSKDIQRAYRATVMIAAKYGRLLNIGEKGDGFMSLEYFGDEIVWNSYLKLFFETVDQLPHHFLMHLIHGAEIVGYKHPDAIFRRRWYRFYYECVLSFHMALESKDMMDARLGDWDREHWIPDDKLSGAEVINV